ncbi:hypothetical protein GCM10009710_13500 [Aeromicrobium alkaliterrae]|uniref:Uncharacterized protein n=1 Tax=Aeromicrobium alkaliterrae TaxID=302168 RepID=A0ABP4VSY8_9ACTN
MLLAAVAIGSLALGACSDDGDDAGEAVYVAQGTTCDQELNSPEAQTINEDVGGLQTPDFTVRFSQTTKLGNVALVSGDTEKAFRVLSEDYGVALVAELEEGEAGTIVGFEQIRDLVADVCGED